MERTSVCRTHRRGASYPSMARLHVLESHPNTAALWRVGRLAAMLGLAALVATLVLAPQVALTSLWYVAVPLLPASFFISPALWRGICPLSTLNAWGNRFGPARELTRGESTAFALAGIVLFHLMVPARHLGLNTDGPLLAAVLVAVAAIAVLSGARYASRSAFCNALCPVLPVERLYGQMPVVPITRGRCDTCTVCTPRGCLDLADSKAMRQVIGPARLEQQWLATPFGSFAASLPGFIVGYGLTPDVGGGDWLRVYGATIGGSIASYALVRTLAQGLEASSSRAVATCAALSGALYYWYTAPMIAQALALPSGAVTAIRALALAGVTLWAVRATRSLDTPATA